MLVLGENLDRGAMLCAMEAAILEENSAMCDIRVKEFPA